MKSGTHDVVKGKFHEAKGKIKRVAGRMTGNPQLEQEGVGEGAAGTIQKKTGQIKKVFGK